MVSDHHRMSELVPWIRDAAMDTSHTGQAVGVGSIRCCNFGNGLVLEEKIALWHPPYLYAYSCLENTNPFGLLGHLSLVVCEAVAPVETVLTWQHYFDHANPQAMQEKMDSSMTMAFQTLVSRFDGKLLESYLNFQ